MVIRSDWTLKELKTLYNLPLMELISKAHCMHLQFYEAGQVQVCHLISVKTGGCPENCKYCAQSAHNKTAVIAQPMMSYEEVLAAAEKAVAAGITRVCLVVAWREVRDNKQFEAILEMVKGVKRLGVEVCCSLGMAKEYQAKRLKEAGLYAYNHNLDSSERFYPEFATTRTYQERKDTLEAVQKAGLSVCCGGIIGMGETINDRLELLHTLCCRQPHPESVPINQLSAVAGTPMENMKPVPIWEVIRMIAVARIVMPRAMVRLSCGRDKMSVEQQALCFMAGANSIFSGEKLLTVKNTPVDEDEAMFKILELKKLPSYAL